MGVLQRIRVALASSPRGAGDDLTHAAAADAAGGDTERRTAQVASDLLDAALAAAGCSAYEWEVVTDRVQRSRHSPRILGMPPTFQQGSGAEWFAHVHPDDVGVLRQALAELSPARPEYQLTYRFRRDDGEVSIIEDRARGEFDDTGKLVRLTGLNRDVTAERGAAAELAASESRLRSILDNSPAEVFLKDLDGRYQFVNAAMARRLGRSAAALVGKTAFDILSRPTAERLVAADRQVLETKQVLDREDRIPIPGHAEAAFHTVLFPLVDARGEPYAICGMAHDITAELEAQRVIRDSRDLLAVATRASNMMAYEWRPEGDVVHRSSNARDWLPGEQLSEIATKDEWLSHLLPEDRPLLGNALAALTPERATYGVIYRYRLANGDVVRIHDFGRGSFDADGRLALVRGLCRVLTAPAEIEEALRVSQQRLEMALEASGAGTWEFDPRSGEGGWSDNYCRLLGYEPGEVQPNLDAWLARVPPEDRDAALAALREHTERGVVPRWDARIRWPDGSEHWLRYHGRADAWEPGGRVSRLRGVVIDVTDLRNAQDQVRALNTELEARVQARTAELEEANRALRDQIRERERAERETARMTALIESTSDLVGIADLRPQRVRYVNRALREAVGHDQTGLSLQEAMDRVHPPDCVAMLRDEAFPQARRTGAWLGANRVRRADGSEMPVSQLLLVTRDERDGQEQVSTIMRDMTESARTEHALRERAEGLAQANAELARATRTKDEFLANMSHELRTPLTAVLGVSEALREGVYGPLLPRQRAALDTVDQSGRHLLDLINDVLDVARIEAGKLALERTEAPLDSICRTSLAMVEPHAAAKPVQLSYEPAADGIVVSCDERRLVQVVVNLLANAVKFTPPGGHVRLVASADRAQGVVQLRVHDDGIGISAADIQRLFQPFSQLDAGLNRQFGGSGLGLSIVRRLVDLHGGSVRVDSEPGRGSCFTVSLPWRAADGAARPAADAPVAGGALAGMPLVLIVDDNHVGAQVMADFLSARGCRTLVAHDGASALRLSEAERPEAVLMDIQMPGMDGLETTRALRALPGMTAVPVIAVTALAMPGDRERCLAAGATDYVTKPVSLVGVLARLRALLPCRAAGATS